jgi:hypothetical protein
MDTAATYRDIVKQTILNVARLRPSHGEIRLDTIFDEAQDRYGLMQVGWDRGRRVRGNLLYIVLRDGKVYVEYDGIGHGVIDELLARGILEEHIVLAYLPEMAV